MNRPTAKPGNPRFGSGPTAKRPGWTPAVLAGALLGRSHRAGEAKAKLKSVIDRSQAMLGMPDDWVVGIVPASDTGAYECAMWSLLGARPVDVVSFESFGAGWLTDAAKQLKLENMRRFEADYGELPDLAQIDPAHDVVFCWNGTTSGVRVPDGEWISHDREGLTICDATSAVFAMDLPWAKLDVVTWSWQKALGGEAQHGMLALSPRAVARLESWTPPWPLPKLFRLTKGGKLNHGIFKGETINTPSMLAVEDALDALDWADGAAPLAGLIARTDANLAAVEAWVARTPWIDFLARDAATRSPTSICLKIVDPEVAGLDHDAQQAFVEQLTTTLADEGVAYDVTAYRDAPPGLRLWGGATVETADLEALFPWLDWAFTEAKRPLAA